MEKRGTSKGAYSSGGGARKGSFRDAGSKPYSKAGAGKAEGARPDGRKPTVYPDLEKRRRIDDAEKAALRRVSVLPGDEVALGCNSSGWPGFLEKLRLRFLQLDKAKIESDRISTIWNKEGFKTGAGRQWTARLVDAARSIAAGSKPVSKE
ncbi:MAG: hypothetical protein WA792_15235 [Pseudolabrys sp.]